jgi:O-phospho-L-seryl-tRNASec:L-selenocysteinyl-tRNA synthase
VWSRIDQKSCLKAIVTSGFELLVLPLVTVGDELRTDAAALETALNEHAGRVLCVVTCSSCFAPRAPDDVEAVARLCSRFKVGHVVNNAYGLQCAATMKAISRAMRVGRVDAVIQSTDKNFLVRGTVVLRGGF